MNLNSSFRFPVEQINDHDQHHHVSNFAPNHQVVPSSPSSSASCHIFLNSSDDHMGFCHRQLHQPRHQEDDNYAYHDKIKDKIETDLKLTLWKNEDQVPEQSILKKDNPVKWASSKMRLMERMKNRDRVDPTISIATDKIEVQKLQPFSSLETDLSSNRPIRVCSDCHTTKTPLWRSGPKGPKSLCNACGIRQRKARRAMAAAAAASGTAVASDKPRPMKIKVQCKEKIDKSGISSSVFKKRRETTDAANNAGSSSSLSGKKKQLGFEDFLINLSNKLAFHRMFPQDEKDAALLLMALSSGCQISSKNLSC